MLARACGKTNVHSLEPEDLAALTVEAAAMAKVPLAGTTYIPGVTEHEILAEVKRLLAIKAEDDLIANAAPPTTSSRCGSRRNRRSVSEHHHELAYAEPEKIKSIDAEFLAGHRFPYQEDISLVEDVDLLAAHPGRGHQLARGHRAARGGRRPGRLRPLLELVPQDLLPDPGRAGRTRSPARC